MVHNSVAQTFRFETARIKSKDLSYECSRVCDVVLVICDLTFPVLAHFIHFMVNSTVFFFNLKSLISSLIMTKWITLGILILIIIGVGIFISKPRTQAPVGTVTNTESQTVTPPEIESPPVTQTMKPPTLPEKLSPNGSHRVTIETNKGTIVFETYDHDAPLASENFVNLARAGFYDNLVFHRVIAGFMMQGGDPSGNGTGGPGYTFSDELDAKSPSGKIGYKKGVLAMANRGPNTNGSQFFIMFADYPLPLNYTIFGHVVSGQDVVDAIGKVETGAGDRPVTPITMTKVTATDINN